MTPSPRFGPHAPGALLDARAGFAAFRVGPDRVLHTFDGAVVPPRALLPALPAAWGRPAELERGVTAGHPWVLLAVPPSWSLWTLAERSRAVALPFTAGMVLELGAVVSRQLAEIAAAGFAPPGVDPLRVRVDAQGEVHLVSPELHLAPGTLPRRADVPWGAVWSAASAPPAFADEVAAVGRLLVWLGLVPLAATRWLSFRRVAELSGTPAPWEESPGFAPALTAVLPALLSPRPRHRPSLPDLARELHARAVAEDGPGVERALAEWLADLRPAGLAEDRPTPGAQAIGEHHLALAATPAGRDEEDEDDPPTEPNGRRVLAGPHSEPVVLIEDDEWDETAEARRH